ncbi:hypothetical protein GCM10028803_21980 [Larkinella knui]|uniref:Uncharacterized protein n=1 Tax=Larkinella knui TaxID=2025310 RepID=A0A3P1CWN4_9BACT|nr:contractile injection system tape measure protein [Larkinella knui]RRB17274.1 hypothetical protein EHT87_03040 [Larkinella knui]
MELRHRIGQHTIDIEISDAGEAVAMQNQLSDLCRQRLYPALEQLFDRFADGETWLRIDRLELDLGTVTPTDWQQQLVEKTVLELEKALRQWHPATAGRLPALIPLQAADRESFLYFLETGSLPWNSPVQQPADWENRLEPTTDLFRQVVGLGQRKPLVLLRLVWQFSGSFLNRLTAFRKASHSEVGLLDAVWQAVAPYLPDSAAGRQTFRHYIRLASAARSSANSPVLDWLKPGIDAFVPVPQRAATEQALREIPKAIAHNQDPTEPVDQWLPNSLADGPAAHYISNAGLVLLHPFLHSLFRELGLLAETRWVDQTAQNRAVLLCQYAVTGQPVMPESDLLLAKILCGMPPEWPVEAELALMPNEEAEVRKLLEAVVSHWKALKNASVASVQESFLQRDGKLSRKDGGWRLQVDPQTIDILLDRLPWGFSLIKSAFMSEILYVEWR